MKLPRQVIAKNSKDISNQNDLCNRLHNQGEKMKKVYDILERRYKKCLHDLMSLEVERQNVLDSLKAKDKQSDAHYKEEEKGINASYDNFIDNFQENLVL